MSREDFDVFDTIDGERRVAGEDRRALADLLLKPAQDLASRYSLTMRPCSESHYQLFPEGQLKSSVHWLLNIYPGNQRLYWDPKRNGPWLRLKRPWTLLDVVNAAIKGIEAAR